MVVDSRQVVFLIPVYNDWEAVGMLLGHLDQAVGGVGQPLSVVLIDDGSTDPVPANCGFSSCPIFNLWTFSHCVATWDISVRWLSACATYTPRFRAERS